MRYGIIDLSTNLVVNVAEIDSGDGSTQPSGFINVQSDVVNIGDSWDGEKLIHKILVAKPLVP